MNERDELDKIYNTIYDLLVNKKFMEVDDMLKNIDLENISITYIIGYLTITAAAKNKLKERSSFYEKVYFSISDKKGKNYTDRLLDGLE